MMKCNEKKTRNKKKKEKTTLHKNEEQCRQHVIGKEPVKEIEEKEKSVKAICK